MDILKGIVFGIVEGITEWLPISSTGHMILLKEIMPFSSSVSQEFWELFEVVIQLGAIMAVVLLFWNNIVPLRILMTPAARSKEIRAYREKKKAAAQKGKHIKNPTREIWRKDVLMLWVKIVICCLPCIVIALPFDDFFEEHFYNAVCVSIMLILFGIAFIVVEAKNKGIKPKVKSISGLSIPMVLVIGIFQLIAGIFPGTSRSGATIVGALLIGIARPVAAEFTFYLAIPTMAGASLLKTLKFIIEGTTMSGLEAAILLVGCIVAFAVSMFVIKFLMGYIKKHTFVSFGIYRIVLGIVVILYFLLINK